MGLHENITFFLMKEVQEHGAPVASHGDTAIESSKVASSLNVNNVFPWERDVKHC